MIESILNFIVESVLPFGAIGVFVASVMEEVIAPIPSALIMTMSGFIFLKGSFSLSLALNLIFKVALPAALGVTLGSYVVFFAARFGGKVVIDKWGKYIGLYYEDVEMLNKKLLYSKKDEITIIIARIIPIVPSVAISALCGVLGISMYKYFVLTLVGTFVRGLLLGVLGWQVGNVYKDYASLLSYFEKYVAVFILLVMVIFFIYTKIRKRES